MHISHKMFLKIVGDFFLIVCVLHILRIALDWSVLIDDIQIPTYTSVIIVIISGTLSYFSFKFSHTEKQ